MVGRAFSEQLRVAGLFAFLAACRPPTGNPTPSGPAAADPQAAAPTCPVPVAALAWSTGDTDCGYVLEGGDAPTLRALDRDRVWTVRMPEACAEQTCDFRIAVTELGPLIVGTRRSPSSEIPSWVGLGIPLGDGYGFVDLWLSESVLDDLTPSGPVHALAPFDCGGSLALLVEPRLGGAPDEVPEPALVSAAGKPSLEGDAVVVEPVAADGCRRLSVELP